MASVVAVAAVAAVVAAESRAYLHQVLSIVYVPATNLVYVYVLSIRTMNSYTPRGRVRVRVRVHASCLLSGVHAHRCLTLSIQSSPSSKQH